MGKTYQTFSPNWVFQRRAGLGGSRRVPLAWPRERGGAERLRVTFLRWDRCFNERLKAFLATLKMHTVPFFFVVFLSSRVFRLCRRYHFAVRNSSWEGQTRGSGGLLPAPRAFRASHGGCDAPNARAFELPPLRLGPSRWTCLLNSSAPRSAGKPDG